MNVSIHLMLLFIALCPAVASIYDEFQYISCCYLSWSFSGKCFKGKSFNTSHVVIYRVKHSYGCPSGDLFQYISCCYLSISDSYVSCTRYVSIHLMLLFIQIYHPCSRWFHEVSIHLMLLFISMNCWLLRIRCVSIHLMLLFIGLDTREASVSKRFQYISCCYLSNIKILVVLNWLLVSIHLMLLFIEILNTVKTTNTMFQYISCCYLSSTGYSRKLPGEVSIHLMLLFILSRFFICEIVTEFQYISCCYLSEEEQKKRLQMFMFQYISCCYLSWERLKNLMIEGRFNTSHVVIYPFKTLFPSFTSRGFNTSHVVIYQLHIWNLTRGKMFQYISCCYLSTMQGFSRTRKPVSIHLMLLFIWQTNLK